MAVVGRQEYLATQHRIINDFQEIGKPALWQEKYDINFHKKKFEMQLQLQDNLDPPADRFVRALFQKLKHESLENGE